MYAGTRILLKHRCYSDIKEKHRKMVQLIDLLPEQNLIEQSSSSVSWRLQNLTQPLYGKGQSHIALEYPPCNLNSVLSNLTPRQICTVV